MAIRVRHLGIGIESTYGTPVAPTIFFECMNESIKFEPVDEEQEVIRSPNLARIKRIAGVVRGECEILLGYQEVGNLLYGIQGGVSKTGANPYTHTSPGAQGIIARPSWTVEVGRDSTTKTWRYQGMIITALSIAFVENQQVRCTIGWVGQDEATGTVATPSYTTDDIIPAHLTASLDAAAQDVMSLNINIARPVDERIPMRGSAVFPSQPPDAGPYSVAGDFTIRAEANLTQYNKFKSGADVDLSFACDSNPAEESLTFNLNKTRLRSGTPNVEGQALSESPYEFTSILDTLATGSLQTVTVNNVADVTV